MADNAAVASDVNATKRNGVAPPAREATIPVLPAETRNIIRFPSRCSGFAECRRIFRPGKRSPRRRPPLLSRTYLQLFSGGKYQRAIRDIRVDAEHLERVPHGAPRSTTLSLPELFLGASGSAGARSLEDPTSRNIFPRSNATGTVRRNDDIDLQRCIFRWFSLVTVSSFNGVCVGTLAFGRSAIPRALCFCCGLRAETKFGRSSGTPIWSLVLLNYSSDSFKLFFYDNYESLAQDC